MIAWLLPPAALKLVLQVAWLLPFNVWVAQPVIVVPSDLKLTVPVGVPAPGEFTVTVAVNVTD